MSQEIVKINVNTISTKYSSDVKEELQDEYYSENKVYVSETTITDTVNITNTELNEYIKGNKTRKEETLSVEHIKTDLSSSEINDTVSNNLKTEDSGICSVDIQNEQLLCNHCNEVYQDYCTKCRVLAHILNKTTCHNTYNRVRELPKYMLETRESIGDLGIFSLKVIPEEVIFGPFTGLNSTGLPLRIKGGRFVVSDDKLEQLNWMQYINHARNIYEQNLFPFQYEGKLYYYSSRRIQKGEELLVYFGEEYEDNLLKRMEMDFVPIIKKDVENVFACTFCCLGFRSKEYLTEHKAVIHGETNEMFSVEELTQCPFCKIYLEAKEYFEHHMDYCCETNDRYCVLPSPEVHGLEVERRPSETRDVKRWKRGIYKCTQCKFRTMYSADFRHHTNKHYEVKMYKCGICHRRYKAKESFKAHVMKYHTNNEGRGIQKYATYDSFKVDIKNINERIPPSNGEKQYQSSKCHLKSLIKAKYLKRGKYKCANCEFKTYYRANLERHIKIKHLMETNCYKCSDCEFQTSYKSSLIAHKNVKHLSHLSARNYKCTECEFKTNYKSSLDTHIKGKHLKQNDYRCTECEFKTNYNAHLKIHIKTKHLKENGYKCMECEYATKKRENLKIHLKSKHLKEYDYKCAECEFKTNYKAHLREHIKTKHLKQSDYKCTECECEYMTNRKADLEMHIKAKHLKQKDYKCAECEYKTNYKAHLKIHIKAKHLKENNYKCVECEFKTSYKSSLTVHIKTQHNEIQRPAK